MTAWLVRLFLKNESPDTPDGHAAYGTVGTSVGIGVNLLLSLVKLLLGALSGSLAVTADGVNNLSDAFGSVVSLVSVRMAKKPMDKEHPFGHGRMEYIGSLGVGALIVALGIGLFRDSLEAIWNPAPISLSLLAAGLLGLSLLVKLWLYFFYRKLGRMIQSAPLLASSKDSLSDLAATGAVLVSFGLQAAFGWMADGYMGVLVALFVLKTGIDVTKNTVGLLLGERPDPEKIKRIEAELLAREGILGVHDLILHDYGPGRCIASVHAEVSAKGNIVDIHEMIDKAEREIGESLNLVLCIHMDPIVTDDETANELKGKLSVYLRHLDERLSLHDFRMVPGQETVNLIFDCVLPDGYTDKEGLMRSLTAYAKSLDSRYELIVQFDSQYF